MIEPTVLSALASFFIILPDFIELILINQAYPSSFDLSQTWNQIGFYSFVTLKVFAGVFFVINAIYNIMDWAPSTPNTSSLGWQIGRMVGTVLFIFDSFMFVAPTYITVETYTLL